MRARMEGTGKRDKEGQSRSHARQRHGRGEIQRDEEKNHKDWKRWQEVAFQVSLQLGGREEGG